MPQKSNLNFGWGFFCEGNHEFFRFPGKFEKACWVDLVESVENKIHRATGYPHGFSIQDTKLIKSHGSYQQVSGRGVVWVGRKFIMNLDLNIWSKRMDGKENSA